MARVRSVDFLPEIFQTGTNKQFLGATLDQLVQEPKFKKTQGFVGRKVGPGVNASDRYVIEPTDERNDYQLEPGVVSLRPDSSTIEDAITYPGITDALAQQGALTNNANRLYTSEYYTWDPFVDFDKFVNFSQYYWLPGGPDEVDVSATDVPLTDNFVVTRENGVYTFSGQAGNNPTLTLVRGGNYTFQVAQNDKETVNFRVGNDYTNAYLIDYEPNPTLTLIRGNTYVFNLVTNGIYPFWIKTSPTVGRGEQYNDGVTRNGAVEGLVTIVVPQDAPDVLYYASENEPNMQGQLNVINATPGTGPGFWIQSDPGVNGRVPSTPNISSRDVLGVINNGEDLGTVTFNVPLSTAQSFYYGLTNNGSVDFATNLKFNQINNQFLVPFLEQHGGIDGVTTLNGKTIIFLNTMDDAEDGGWEITTQFDPLTRTEPNQVGQSISYDVTGENYDIYPYNTITDIVVSGQPDPQDGVTGSYDTTLFDQTTPIVSQDLRYSVWQIEYVTTQGGGVYIRLNSVRTFNKLEKCNILYGDTYASTQWYRNADGYFQQIPLLTAIKDTLWYQDGTDPEIFGQIRLINPEDVSTIDIDDILGRPNYISPNGVTLTNGLKITFRGSVIPSTYVNNSYYVEGVGSAIRLLPVTDFITPETYTNNLSTPYDSLPYDVGNFDATLNAPLIPDYITINRASPDRNAWSRSNRWFHIDVINVSAAYNNTDPVINQSNRAKRPILEFQSGLRLWNFGTSGKTPVNTIDFDQTDAFSNINGTIGYSTDGYTFIQGSRVIFANDRDPQVRNKIYEVTFITPDSVPPLIAQPIINLVPASDSQPWLDQTVVCLNGVVRKGKSFWFDGVTWQESQEKTAVNQPPLFNVYDTQGVSFGDRARYGSSTFQGSKLFSYAQGTGADDTVLGFPLRYLSLTNVGDIVFDNNLYTDTFVYVPDAVSVTQKVSDGFVRQYANRSDYGLQLGWQTAVTKSYQRQQFQFSYDGSPLRLDVPVNADDIIPSVQIFVSQEWIAPSKYSVSVEGDITIIVLNEIYVPGSVIEVLVLSDTPSAQGFYEVPDNLENNPFNVNSPRFTLGTVRSHYQTICENLLGLQGKINGANNTRDLGDIGRYGTQILQQSAPMTLAGFFMRNPEYNIFRSLAYNDREYTKFKNRMLDAVIRNDWGNMTTSQILDAVITDLATGKTNINPFYWSDMLPAGSVYTENIYTVTPISTSVFDTVQTYDFREANYLGLLVYLRRNVNTPRLTTTTLLTLHTDYTVAEDGPRIDIRVPLSVGDQVIIREYANTAGTFVPNTPTKLGLYPSWIPRQFVDPNYVNPTTVIQGHDGSVTVAFNDIRDGVLLEFERRIFNNLKNKGNPVPLLADEVIPGYFRSTDYSQQEITAILSESFLSWVGWNKIDYKYQDFVNDNPFTYNYSTAGDKEKNQPLLGAWRGISRYFYDTLSPNLTPWEMLGLTQKPTWWEERYGPAPYTGDNLVLWDDIEAGYVADPVAPYFKPNFARPGLVRYFIPNGDEGQLLPPIDSVVGQYDPTDFRKSWVVGDGGPAEAAWWQSSSYPFAVMRLLALTRPAEFFSLFADRDLYRYDDALGQYLYNGRYRLDANGVQVYGNGVSKASYINWIVDFNQQLGRNSTTALETALANLDVRLCWRMASYSDKQYLKIFTERSSPNSLNSSLLLPDESYSILLYKNVPFEYVTYSSVIVQKVEGGWSVYGYDNLTPYFEILASRANGNLQTIAAGGSSVTVPRDYSNDIVQVPYGYVFTNQTVVVDFLLSYGRLLSDRGLIFDDKENGYVLNWRQMAQEFLYWANQGWATGSVINLNPCARRLIAERPGAVVDNVLQQDPENLILDQNRTPLDARNLIIQRLENNFTITSATEQTISYIRLRWTNFEHMVVVDNVSIFNDLLFDPVTAARQNRVKVVGTTSTEWNGTVDAQGFIINENNVQEWRPNRKYSKGEIVLYKNQYWSAQTIVQPKLEFDFTDWVKSDYTQIELGLLPNIPNKADQLSNTYNTQVANLERDNDLLSYGLIGFRPRQYMSALNLDDVSQVNLYQQFLKTKGTVRSAEVFTGANLGKEVADYQIYENWAVQQGVYGANANRSYFELRLNEALLKSDPSTIQVVEPGQPSIADQQILLSDVWKQSYKLTSPDILPTTVETPTDTALPSAGYVNLDDVDITVFSLDNPSAISAALDQIGIGTKIWVARTNAYDWNVYRCSQTPGFISSLSDNLDGTSLLSFTQPHNLRVGDLLIIRFFADSVNGVYRVLNVPGPTTLTIAYTFPQGSLRSITGAGIGFFLQTMRVSQASDAVNLPYATQLIPGAMIWVDDDGTGHWEVLEKQQTFFTIAVLEPSVNDNSTIVNSGFGSSVAQAKDNLFAFVGAPSFADNGAVYSYLRAASNAYAKNNILTLSAPFTYGFGNSVDIGDQSWGVAGASASWNNVGYATTLYRIPASNNFEFTQLLVPPDQDFSAGKFGQSVSISSDERWLYVSAPASNAVYAYGRVDIPEQYVEHITDGVTSVYNYSDHITVNADEQLVVTVNNNIQEYNISYSVNANAVVFGTPPAMGQRLVIRRRSIKQLDQQTYFSVEQDLTSGSGNGAQFTVDRTRGVYNPTLSDPGSGYTASDTLTIFGPTIGGGTTPANDLVITVTAVDGMGGIQGFTYSGQGVTNTSVFPLDPYLYTATNIFSFTVLVNNELQRPFIDYDFNSDSSLNPLDIVFNNIPPAGAQIVVTTGTYWQYVDRMSVAGLDAAANFGYSIASSTDGRQIMIGCPNDTVTVSGITEQAGSVYMFDRSVIRYLVDDADQTTYAIPGAFSQPVAVKLNGQFLTNAAQYMDGDFLVSGSDVILQGGVITAVGDVIEIETNQFQQTQKITQTSLYDQAQFGASVDLCPTNCSLYVGAPLDGKVLLGAGSVQRSVNQARLYGVISSTVANASLTAGDTIRINNYEVAVPAAGTVAALSVAINSSGIPNVTSSVDNGIITISVINDAAATPLNKLSVLPGVITTGPTSVFDALGIQPFAFTQTITSPNASINAKFGASVFIDSTADNLVVGAPQGDVYAPTTFDQGTTYFDDRSTTVFAPFINSGVVYTFDYLSSANDSVTNPGKFVFGVQIFDSGMQTNDLFGTAVSYVSGKLAVGSPGWDAEDSTVNYGRISIFNNPQNLLAWTVKHRQRPVVDTRLLNSVFMYDKLESTITSYLDFFNPLQGKILGVAKENIDYVGAVDPANYNQGPIHNQGNPWGREHLGEIWWDTNAVRFIDPNQDDIVYASRRWGQVFPGSRVDIYQWIESRVPPRDYTGPGSVLSPLTFTTRTAVDNSGLVVTLYYYWVRNIPTVATTRGKKLSTTAIASYIENPRASGIAYLAPLSASTVAVYNVLPLISAQDTILHIEYDRQFTEDNVHVEYELISQGKADSFINDTLYLKLQDSFCGVNLTGALVPDPTLSPAEQYGVQFRPRQSMFADRFAALKNYLSRANSVLKNFPISETRKFNLLNSSEPEPTAASGAWNKRVANLEELGYQNLAIVPYGYKYLVVSDSSQGGLWTIYDVVSGPLVGSKELVLIRVQNYDTKKYWSYIDWYMPGYNASTNPVTEVANYAGLDTLDVPVGSSVKVTANAQGKFEIYQRTVTGWDRVGLQDGTIEFSAELWDYALGRFGFDVEVFDAQYFDQEPVIETRKIIQAINQELFVDDLLIERNRALTLIFDYVYTEFEAPEWLIKTSLIEVDHRIRDLVPYQVYLQDNQDFVLDYIQEVKPYHVQIREFNLTYDGNDAYPGNVTDFDLPAYWDASLVIPQFVSPILLPYTKSTSTTGQSSASDISPSSTRWTDWPWSQWFNNYLLTVEDVIITDPGAGYTVPPEVVVTGDCQEPAVLTAVVNSAGRIVAVNVVSPGVGYSTTAVITFVGGNGLGGRAYAVMGNGLVRSIKTTIKYDRYEYDTIIVDWQPNVNYDNGTLVRYLDRVWQADSDDSTGVEGSTFDPDQWSPISAADLSGVNRTMGFYAPTANEPGLELPLLIDGVDYPGVQVKGVNFDQNTGFDVGNYDINPFDNLAYGPEGLPTYDPAILDAIYGSSYLDVYLGTRPTDINVDGGEYVDTYSSHAPEELVPGSEFDTLDFRVYTSPGADWTGDGHGFATEIKKFNVVTLPQTFSFAGVLPYTATVLVSNQTWQREMTLDVDYTVDWAQQTVTVLPTGANINDIVAITACGLGGGNQLFKQVYNGSEIGNAVTIPVQFSIIQQLAIFVNGQPISAYTYAQVGSTNTTEITFTNTYTINDYVFITAIGPTTVGSSTVAYGWSTALTQYLIADGGFLYTLPETLTYSNPDNLVVTINGLRVRTPAGIQYVADGSSAYLLPDRLGFSQSLIADVEVRVYINDVRQILGVNYFVEPFDISSDQPRAVLFVTPPTLGEKITIYVTTNSQAWVSSGNQLLFDQYGGFFPLAGDIIGVTTWNDPRQQDILTQIYVGPVQGSVTVQEGYDETLYDAASLSDTPGSFDYAAGQAVTLNNLFLNNTVTDTDRIVVYLNGHRLFINDEYIVVNDEIILASGILNPTDVVIITTFTNSVTPNPMAFRIFQDMRGAQATYRITPETTTYLVRPLLASDDVIYVHDASALSEPDVASNVWGVLTINGERIMYRERNLALNTVSSLRRGTAGTAAASHSVDSLVYDMGRGNLLDLRYQDRLISNSTLANGSTVVFDAPDIDLTGVDSTSIEEALLVYVGGTLQNGGYTITADSPVSVTFAEAPPDGVEVTLAVRQGQTWYQPGLNTPSDGVALQDTQTPAARFLRGEI